MPAPRRLFVTTALPYANGNFHIGHIMEYIQADIWVRFQRMNGAEVHFVGADDAHGAPIMIAAEKQGKTPQAFVADLLRRAHAAGREATDDAALVEALGGTVRVVPGDPRNLKITTPADLDRVEHLLRG